MTERDVETIVQRALEQHPNQKPRIISDNGPPFMRGTSRSSSVWLE